MSKVGIIMGSKSDYPVMKDAVEILEFFEIDFEIDIVSAHRTPEKMMEYSKNAHKNGISVIIAGAGGAAHLPGMVASIDVLAGKRTIFDYIWQPMLKVKERAFTD